MNSEPTIVTPRGILKRAKSNPAENCKYILFWLCLYEDLTFISCESFIWGLSIYELARCCDGVI